MSKTEEYIRRIFDILIEFLKSNPNKVEILAIALTLDEFKEKLLKLYESKSSLKDNREI